jgi:hypothetical protein
MGELIPACGDIDSCAHAPCSEQDSHIPLDRRTFLQWLSRWWRGHDEREGTGTRFKLGNANRDDRYLVRL